MTKIAKVDSDREQFTMTLADLAREGARRLIVAARDAERGDCIRAFLWRLRDFYAPSAS